MKDQKDRTLIRREFDEAFKKYVIKDAATAGEILIQTSNNLPKKS